MEMGRLRGTLLTAFKWLKKYRVGVRQISVYTAEPVERSGNGFKLYTETNFQTIKAV